MESNKKDSVVLVVCSALLIILSIISVWFILDCQLKEPYVFKNDIKQELPRLSVEEIEGEEVERISTVRPVLTVKYLINRGEKTKLESIHVEGAEDLAFIASDRWGTNPWFVINNNDSEIGIEKGRYSLCTVEVFPEDSKEWRAFVKSGESLKINKATINFRAYNGEIKRQIVDLGEIILEPEQKVSLNDGNSQDESELELNNEFYEEIDYWGFWEIRSFLKEKEVI